MSYYKFTPAKKFFHAVGKARTEIPWFRPDPEYLNRWKDDLFKINIASEFRFFAAGGMIQDNSKTWDSDIRIYSEEYSLTKSPKLFPKIEHIMFSMTQLGFKHRQLIEPFCGDYDIDFLTSALPCDNWYYSCQAFLDNGSCTREQCVETSRERSNPVKRIRYGYNIFSNGKWKVRDKPLEAFMGPNGPEFDRFGELVITDQSRLPNTRAPIYPKIVEKINKGKYKNRSFEITPDTDFREFLKWP